MVYIAENLILETTIHNAVIFFGKAEGGVVHEPPPGIMDPLVEPLILRYVRMVFKRPDQFVGIVPL